MATPHTSEAEPELNDIAPIRRVHVLLPLPLGTPYDYAVQPGESIEVGDFVTVPLGKRAVQGVVWGEGPADPSVLGDKKSPAVGKFTHPSGAPDNHLLTIYSPGPANHQYKYLPQIDGGIYLLKNGKVIDEPSKLLLIKNDNKYQLYDSK